MKKTGLAHSPLFKQPAGVTFLDEAKDVKGIEEKTTFNALDEAGNENENEENVGGETMVSSHRDTMVSNNHATTVPNNHDVMPPRHRDTIQQVREAVGEIGKEAATHRFTKEEKEAVAELIYIYKRKGVKTTENEIVRIALNYMIILHREAGDKSLLSEVLSLV